MEAEKKYFRKLLNKDMRWEKLAIEECRRLSQERLNEKEIKKSCEDLTKLNLKRDGATQSDGPPAKKGKRCGK